MVQVKQVEVFKVVPTIDSRRLGTNLLNHFVQGEKLPKPSHGKEVIKIILGATKELKAIGIEDITVEDYARYFCLLSNQALVKNALLFCTSDKEGHRQLNEILHPEKKAIA